MPLWIDQEQLNNPERLYALRSLQLPDAATLDGITRRALTALRVPVSLISLVAPRRDYVLSGQGLPEWPNLQTAPSGHDYDFLGKYSLSGDNVTNIGVVRDHDELALNPTVEALNIQAYLSAPLRSPEGHILGAVSAIDHRPRTWTPGEIATITQLADLANREIRALQARRIRASDATRSAASTMDSPGYAYVHHDTADRNRVDAAALQAQTMESLGALAEGVAHDFNNLLTAVRGSVGAMRLSTGLTPGDVEGLDSIEQSAHAAADITGNLLNFAHGELSRLDVADGGGPTEGSGDGHEPGPV